MSEKNRNLIWLFAFLLILIGILPLLMWGLGGGYMSEMMGMMGYGYGYGFTLLIPIVFLVLIVLGAYYFVTGSAEPRRSASNHSRRALEILRERYAKGEITKEQFLEMKAEL